MKRVSLGVKVLCAVASVGALSFAGCNKRVFQEVETTCTGDVVADVDVPIARAADILIIVDNSGSMEEEQAELARNFVNPACPIDLNNPIPEQFQNPNPALYAEGGPLQNCGFIQLVAAFDNDFRVGVVTTDVGMLDDRFDNTVVGLPQRGCLQRDDSGGTSGRKLIARADLLDDDAGNDDLAARFSNMLENVGIDGSPAERGLDAAAVFLDPAAARAEGCEDDLSLFRRPDAQLVLLFLSDEEDCSRSYGADSPIPDEAEIEFANWDRPCTNNDQCLDGALCQTSVQRCGTDTLFSQTAPRCYEEVDELPSTTTFVNRILALDPLTKVAAIVGLVPSDQGFERVGCAQQGGGVIETCYPSRGLSIYTDDGELCSNSFTTADFPDVAEFERAVSLRRCTLNDNGTGVTDCDFPCCQADVGNRYLDFADGFKSADGQSNSFIDSICKPSYRDTMLKLAAFIASVDIVRLADRPKGEGLIIVEVTRVGTETAELVRPVGADACATEDGYYYDDEQVAVVFCGDARPRPGDAINIRAAAARDDAAGSVCGP